MLGGRTTRVGYAPPSYGAAQPDVSLARSEARNWGGTTLAAGWRVPGAFPGSTPVPPSVVDPYHFGTQLAPAAFARSTDRGMRGRGGGIRQDEAFVGASSYSTRLTDSGVSAMQSDGNTDYLGRWVDPVTGAVYEGWGEPDGDVPLPDPEYVQGYIQGDSGLDRRMKALAGFEEYVPVAQEEINTDPTETDFTHPILFNAIVAAQRADRELRHKREDFFSSDADVFTVPTEKELIGAPDGYIGEYETRREQQEPEGWMRIAEEHSFRRDMLRMPIADGNAVMHPSGDPRDIPGLVPIERIVDNGRDGVNAFRLYNPVGTVPDGYAGQSLPPLGPDVLTWHDEADILAGRVATQAADLPDVAYRPIDTRPSFKDEGSMLLGRIASQFEDVAGGGDAGRAYDLTPSFKDEGAQLAGRLMTSEMDDFTTAVREHQPAPWSLREEGQALLGRLASTVPGDLTNDAPARMMDTRLTFRDESTSLLGRLGTSTDAFDGLAPTQRSVDTRLTFRDEGNTLLGRVAAAGDWYDGTAEVTGRLQTIPQLSLVDEGQSLMGRVGTDVAFDAPDARAPALTKMVGRDEMDSLGSVRPDPMDFLMDLERPTTGNIMPKLEPELAALEIADAVQHNSRKVLDYDLNPAWHPEGSAAVLRDQAYDERPIWETAGPIQAPEENCDDPAALFAMLQGKSDTGALQAIDGMTTFGRPITPGTTGLGDDFFDETGGW